MICLHVLDFPELAVARIELSSKRKLVYLRIEESATEIWLKVELHCVMDDTKAKENLLRWMNGVTEDRDTPEKFGTELKLEESQFTLKTIIKVLGISERHVRRLYRGKVSFEKTRKIQLENINEDYGEEPEYEIMDEIVDVQDCEDKEESVSRRIVIVEDMEESRHKEHQEQEAKERHKQKVKEHQEKVAKEQEQEAKERREQEEKERQELEAKEQDQTATEQQKTDEYRAEKLLNRGGMMPLFPPGKRQREINYHFVKSNQNALIANKLEGIHPNREVNKLKVCCNGAGA